MTGMSKQLALGGVAGMGVLGLLPPTTFSSPSRTSDQAAKSGAAARTFPVPRGANVAPARGVAAPCGVLAGATIGAAFLASTASRKQRGHRARQSARLVSTIDQQETQVEKPTDAPDALEEGQAMRKKLKEYVEEHGGERLIRRVLIANNGMAATKAIMSMRQWSYLELDLDGAFEFVAMATREDLDANAEYIRLADTYVEVPGGKNINNYANVDLICEVAAAQGVDAVWPGWGHASENPKLPAKLSPMGIIFIGPTSPVMSVLGDKIASNILAQTAGVPSIPWSGDGLTAELTEEGTIPDEVFRQGLIASLEEAIACANRIGYPVMLKASEGGGGKGIRMSNNEEELISHYPQVLGEVPGSPVFMMQLCQGARHVEVQIMGDMHGHAVALSGRDCSTQRRFQKIFEEGPPSIVPKETFREMERAAQQLTQTLGYIGAGTVEYLYDAQKNKYYFLELNPRLQVEHPVTELVCGVNMPATQLQVLMGIPLEKIPEIRKFYGKSEDDTTSPIDFMKDDYVYPQHHVLAARITAENPDDGFKPTSGIIQRIKFQSSVSCWGYFGYGANGRIHEYADSQFGHIFVKGKDREEAIKVLTFALKQLEVVGDIRTPVDYLIELLNTEAFKENTITTAWLDGLIKQRSLLADRCDRSDVVFYAAVFRAMRTLREIEAALLEDLSRGQLGLLREVGSINTFPIEITFEGMRYNFRVSRTAADWLRLEIGDVSIEAKVRTQADGSIFVTVGNSVMKVMGQEEPLGLRLRLGGVGTVMIPTVYDPSELRSEFNGKVVRFLQENGDAVQEGEPYVELEAMKMIMPIRATSTGKVTHMKSAGSIVQAGELLSKLELEDPSSARQIASFSGHFELDAFEESSALPHTSPSAADQLSLVMQGYTPTAVPTELVQQLLTNLPPEQEEAAAIRIIDEYLGVEGNYVDDSSEGKSKDQIQSDLIAANRGDLKKVVHLAMAHSQLPTRNEVVLATLRNIENLTVDAQLSERLQALEQLPPEFGYDDVKLEAERRLKNVDVKSFSQRLAELRECLVAAESSETVVAMTQWKAARAGIDLLAELFSDADARVRTRALETYVRRVYRTFLVESLDVVDEGPGKMKVVWRFQYPGANECETASTRMGYLQVIPTASDMPAALATPLPLAKMDVEASAPLNTWHVVVADGSGEEMERLVPEMEDLLQGAAAKLEAADAREVCLMLDQPERYPQYATFCYCMGWKEDPVRRDMRPTYAHLLEVPALAESYDLKRVVPTIGRNSQVYLGTQKSEGLAKGPTPTTVFVRMISHAALKFHADWMKTLEPFILQGLDEVERANLSVPAKQKGNSNLFLHLMSSAALTPEELSTQFERLMSKLISKHGGRVQHARVDEIVIKVGIGREVGGRRETLRFCASSTSGEYLKEVCLREVHDPVTGRPIKWFDLETGAERSMSLVPDAGIQRRRSMARRAGSTYAVEFLGMMKVALIESWNEYAQRSSGVHVPTNLFQAVELVLGEDGELEVVDRAPCKNDIGMLAWRCTMQTLEYPEGRDIVVIINDVTFKAGSFAVAEDHFFQKASEYARKRGLPRIHIACNSGARVGLVEELKPLVRARWVDADDSSKGFEYLYLTQEDYSSLGEGVVEAHKAIVDGEVQYVLDAIIGDGMKSTAGGIGVENLQGSGLIAGETSKAYNETFTLSYISGRSVGIGAYLNRLGQRVIQMVHGPIILTGFSALNKLLGRTVYTSQDQLGGPQVMLPNGVTHQLVENDQEGVSAILHWLSYVPKDVKSLPPQVASPDPIDRDITFMPTKEPYDPRHMLAGTTTPTGVKLSGFFDEGSFKEYLPGWGRSVVIGRAKLGGIPMGVIAVETRNVERRIPADPANPKSREMIEPQAGQVWYPDSAFKTAQALRDFNRGENLPVIIFANWRGFSGGTRDMYGEVLKYGSQIVDALVEYNHPVFIYIPPKGELRGGSWVVLDPKINPQQMEMYADLESRGGILEPAGVVEVRFREQEKLEMMHRLDAELISLDAQLDTAAAEEEADVAEVQERIRDREKKLKPLYTQLACEFADLHDRTGRMKAKGVIREGIEWRRARKFFYNRLRRRLLEKELVDRLCTADGRISGGEAREMVESWMPSGDDAEVVAFLQSSPMEEALQRAKKEAAKRQAEELKAKLSNEELRQVWSP